MDSRPASDAAWGLWRDLYDRHWMLVVFGYALHYYHGRGRKQHFYFLRYPKWEHPNLCYPEFRRGF